MTIRDWPADERPREKLLDKGPQSLSDAELLALCGTLDFQAGRFDSADQFMAGHKGIGGLRRQEQRVVPRHHLQVRTTYARQ